MDTERQKKLLIDLIVNNRKQQCNELIDKANVKSRDMIITAYVEARSHVHDAVESERARAGNTIRSVEAELSTKHRAVKQGFSEQLLQQGWSLLDEQLKQTWLQNEGRRQWIKRCANEAVKCLPAGDWVISHPLDCTAEQLSEMASIITEKLPATKIELSSSSDIKAGLIIRADKTRLDMSLAGLSQDRKMIEARMLALFHKVTDV
jgi:hypothetical protein